MFLNVLGKVHWAAELERGCGDGQDAEGCPSCSGGHPQHHSRRWSHPKPLWVRPPTGKEVPPAGLQVTGGAGVVGLWSLMLMGS